MDMLADLAVDPDGGTAHVAHGCERDHKQKPRHGSYEPPPECRVNYDIRHAFKTEAKRVTLGNGGRKTIRDHKEVGQADKGSDPGAPTPAADETLADINRAPEPEDLAGKEYQADH